MECMSLWKSSGQPLQKLQPLAISGYTGLRIIFTNSNSHLQYLVIHLQQMESRGLRKILSEISSTCNEWSPGDLEKFRLKNFIHLQRMDAQGLSKIPENFFRQL